MAQTEQSKAAARMRKRSRGGYEQAKETEGRPNTRMLPAGVKDAIGKTTGAIFEENENGVPVFTIQGVTVEPEEYDRMRCDLRFWFQDSQYNKYEDIVEDFVAHCKMLGLHDLVEVARDEAELCISVAEYLNDPDVEIPFRFDTYRKLNKSGYPIIQLQGLAEDAERPTPRKAPPGRAPFVEGDTVITTGNYFADGEEYTGVVVEVDIDEVQCLVKFDDDDSEQLVPFSNLANTSAEEESGEQSDSAFEEGDIVECFDFYDDDYTGKVVSVDDDTVVIEFEDGEAEVPIEHVRLNS